MKKRNLVILIIGIALLCNSCFVDRQQTANAVEININSAQSVYDTVSRKVDFIILTGLELITSISKMIVANEKIYLLDGNTSTVYIYKLNGDFVDKIDRRGQGPGEYLRLRDFNIQNDSLYLYDDRTKKLLCYDLKKMRCIKTIFTPFFARAFALLKNGNFLFVLPKDQNHKQVVITNEKCDIRNEYVQFQDDDLDNRTRYSLLQETDLGIIYSKPEYNNVYVFSKEDGSLIKEYTILIDGKKEVRKSEHNVELYITPLLMKNGQVIGNYRKGANRYFFDISLTEEMPPSIKNFADKRNRVTDLLYPVCMMNDSVAGSYILNEQYEYLDHSVLLSNEMEKYLKLGGFLIGLYPIK